MALLRAQAALETAVRDALCAQLGYKQGVTCDRMFDGRPPPRSGQVFCAVWWPGRRDSQSRTCLDEVAGVHVTVTRRVQLPFDRQVLHRDEVEQRLDDIRALVHKDSLDFRISNAASQLCGYQAGQGPDPGFVEALAFEGLDDWQLVGGDWFMAGPRERMAGVAQTARFGKSRHVQAQTLEA